MLTKFQRHQKKWMVARSKTKCNHKRLLSKNQLHLWLKLTFSAQPNTNFSPCFMNTEPHRHHEWLGGQTRYLPSEERWHWQAGEDVPVRVEARELARGSHEPWHFEEVQAMGSGVRTQQKSLQNRKVSHRLQRSPQKPWFHRFAEVARGACECGRDGVFLLRPLSLAGENWDHWCKPG